MLETLETSAEAPIEIGRYAVFGQPIAHSRSPAIHRQFAQQAHLALSYVAIESGTADFARALAHFAADGGRGANVTLPLKATAHGLCHTHGPHAKRSGVVNTVTRRDDGTWHGTPLYFAELDAIRDAIDIFPQQLRLISFAE